MSKNAVAGRLLAVVSWALDPKMYLKLKPPLLLLLLARNVRFKMSSVAKALVPKRLDRISDAKSQLLPGPRLRRLRRVSQSLRIAETHEPRKRSQRRRLEALPVLSVPFVVPHLLLHWRRNALRRFERIHRPL